MSSIFRDLTKLYMGRFLLWDPTKKWAPHVYSIAIFVVLENFFCFILGWEISLKNVKSHLTYISYKHKYLGWHIGKIWSFKKSSFVNAIGAFFFVNSKSSASKWGETISSKTSLFVFTCIFIYVLLQYCYSLNVFCKGMSLFCILYTAAPYPVRPARPWPYLDFEK